MNTLFDLKDNRAARWVALALFLLAILTRLPFQSEYLYHWDSVNMAFGVQEFNVLTESPQYPGYIVYIVLAQAADKLFNAPQRTMVIISMISSGLAAVAMFYLGRDMFNPVTGLIAALFLITSPLIWFYGEIALPHTLDLFTVILAAWLLYKIMVGETRWLWWTTVFLALVGGFRQQTLLFLAPLAIFAGYRLGIVKILMVGLMGLVTTLAWFIPLMSYSGGLQSYMAGSGAYSARFFDTTSLLAGAGLFGLQRNLVKLIPYTLYGWSVAILPALYWLPKLPSRWKGWLRNRKVWFLLLWMAPAVGFYVFIHMGQQGLVFVFLPALLLISAEGLYRLFQSRPAALRVATAVITLISAAVFVFGPTYPLGQNGPKILTYNTLRESDQLWRARITALRENFAPDDTLLLAANWRHVQYYLPEYRFIRFTVGAKYEIDAGQVSGADFVNQPLTPEMLGFPAGEDWQVVIMDQDIEAFADAPLESVVLPDGYALAYLPLESDEAYFTDGAVYGPREITPSG